MGCSGSQAQVAGKSWKRITKVAKGTTSLVEGSGKAQKWNVEVVNMDIDDSLEGVGKHSKNNAQTTSENSLLAVVGNDQPRQSQ